MKPNTSFFNRNYPPNIKSYENTRYVSPEVAGELFQVSSTGPENREKHFFHLSLKSGQIVQLADDELS